MNADDAYRLLHKQESKDNVLHQLDSTVATLILNLHIKNNFSFSMVLDHSIRTSMRESDIILFVQSKLQPYQGDEARYTSFIYYYCGRQWLSVFLCKKNAGGVNRQSKPRLKNADLAYSEVMSIRGRTPAEVSKLMRDLMLTLFASLTVENKFTNTKEVPPEIQLYLSREGIQAEVDEYLKSKAGSIAKYTGELVDDGVHPTMIRITLISL